MRSTMRASITLAAACVQYTMRTSAWKMSTSAAILPRDSGSSTQSDRSVESRVRPWLARMPPVPHWTMLAARRFSITAGRICAAKSRTSSLLVMTVMSSTLSGTITRANASIMAAPTPMIAQAVLLARSGRPPPRWKPTRMPASAESVARNVMVKGIVAEVAAELEATAKLPSLATRSVTDWLIIICKSKVPTCGSVCAKNARMCSARRKSVFQPGHVGRWARRHRNM
mmetsp:Transcript_54516/g.159169  ORF Transcript_54516/g.159169 Transcript_54516/m.159169 type:complete len:228 (+) Transcript_54516:154-837(+)